jgi:head-tail adaptor
MSFLSLLNKTVEIRRPQRVTDPGGGSSRTYVTVGTVKCRIRPLISRLMDRTGNEIELGHQGGTYVRYVMYCMPNEDVQRNDLVVDGSKTYEVDAVLIDSKGHHLDVRLRERQRGN